jgi:hypothetical protein
MEDSIDIGYLLFHVPFIDDTTHFIKHLQRPVIAQYFIVRINNKLPALCELIVYGKGAVYIHTRISIFFVKLENYFISTHNHILRERVFVLNKSSVGSPIMII